MMLREKPQFDNEIQAIDALNDAEMILAGLGDLLLALSCYDDELKDVAGFASCLCGACASSVGASSEYLYTSYRKSKGYDL